MELSRRNTIGIVIVSSINMISGCTTSNSISKEENSDTTFEARLAGPETDEHLFDKADIETVGEIQEEDTMYTIPVTLTDDATKAVRDIFRTAEVDNNPGEFEIVQIMNEKVVNQFGIAPGFAESIIETEWDGKFSLTFEEREKATEIRKALS